MTPRQLNALADSLEREFITAEDRKGWIADLRAHARDLETGVIFAAPVMRVQAAEPGPRNPEHMDEQQLRAYFDANVRHLPNATSHPFRIHAPGISLQSTSKERLWRFFREKVAGTRTRTPSRAAMEDPNA